MITKIKTLEDVKVFAKQIIEEGVSFHPDDDFNIYVNIETANPIYTKDQAELRNKLMDQCFEICEKNDTDIYDNMYEVYLKETGLDKYFPLPSNNSNT